MEELIGDQGSQIFNSESGLMGGKLYFYAATIEQFPIKLFFGLLSILSIVHLDESEVFLRVEENIGEFSELAEVLLQTLLCGGWIDVTDVKPRPATEFPLRGVDRGKFMGWALNLLEPGQCQVTSAPPE